MEESTLKQLWLNVAQQKIEINTNKLIESINPKISTMEKQIKNRDRREIIICALMILIFGWWFFTIPQALGKIGAAIIIATCVMVIFRLIYASKINVPQDSASEINHHLRVSLQHVRKQINLYNTMLWWYLLPFFIGVICFFYNYPVSLLSKGCYTLVVAVLYGYIYYINRRVVTKKLKPLESSILKTLEELSEEIK